MLERTERDVLFFIPFFNPFLESPTLENVTREFHDEVLKNWYIPIYNNELIVYLTDNIGSKIKIDKDYLMSIEQLKFKLEILEWFYSYCPPDDRFIKEVFEVEVPGLKEDYINVNNKFASGKQKVKLDLVIRKIDEDEIFNNEWDTCNKVSLTRNRNVNC